MTLNDIKKEFEDVAMLCDDRYKLMTCIRDYLHNYDALERLNLISPSEILSDASEYCVISKTAIDVENKVKTFLESL